MQKPAKSSAPLVRHRRSVVGPPRSAAKNAVHRRHENSTSERSSGEKWRRIVQRSTRTPHEVQGAAEPRGGGGGSCSCGLYGFGVDVWHGACVAAPVTRGGAVCEGHGDTELEIADRTVGGATARTDGLSDGVGEAVGSAREQPVTTSAVRTAPETTLATCANTSVPPRFRKPATDHTVASKQDVVQVQAQAGERNRP